MKQEEETDENPTNDTNNTRSILSEVCRQRSMNRNVDEECSLDSPLSHLVFVQVLYERERIYETIRYYNSGLPDDIETAVNDW